MRAHVQRGFGGEEVVGFEDVPDPLPVAGEVLVDVRACGLNRLDLLQRVAPVVRGFALPHIAGMDVAGVVVGGDGHAVGTRVLVDPVITCGVCDRCAAGLSPYCLDLRTVGSTRPGGFAELVAVPADHCYELPAAMSFVDAATLPVAGMTAYHALEAGGLGDGETVLVNGAGAGVSVALLALLLARGATVITTAAGPEKVARALEVGYHHAVDRLHDDVVTSVRDVTGRRGVDLVIDHVGPALFRQSVDALAIGGRMVFCGTTTGREATIALTDVYHWGRTLIGAGGYRADEFPLMLAAFAAAGRAPVIDSVHPFDRLPDAQRAMAAGEFFGKLVIER